MSHLQIRFLYIIEFHRDLQIRFLYIIEFLSVILGAF